MAYSVNSISKHNARITSTLLTYISNSAGNNSICSFANCTIKPISRCSRCSECYCYNHAYGHIHNIENFEIL